MIIISGLSFRWVIQLAFNADRRITKRGVDFAVLLLFVWTLIAIPTQAAKADLLAASVDGLYAGFDQRTLEWINGELQRAGPDFVTDGLFRWHTIDRAKSRYFDRLTGYPAWPDRGANRIEMNTGPHGSGKGLISAIVDPERMWLLGGDGCCSYGREFFLEVHSTAPETLLRAHLQGIRTVRGVMLGMPMIKVQELEGGPGAVVHSSAGTILGYFREESRTCVQERTFVFQESRLRAIQIAEGC